MALKEICRNNVAVVKFMSGDVLRRMEGVERARTDRQTDRETDRRKII